MKKTRGRCGHGVVALALLGLSLAGTLGLAQTAVTGKDATAGGGASPGERVTQVYVLGSYDEVRLSVSEDPEFGMEGREIDPDGYLHLPLLGRVQAAGLRVTELEAAVTERLREYIREPHVVVVVTAYRSRPVSVIGAIERPGVLTLRGPLSLVEVLSQAGGLRPDAGHRVWITRRLEHGALPLAHAEVDSSGQFSLAELDLRAIMEARRPADNLLVQPHDVVAVPPANQVYVVGAVERAGGFALRERRGMTVVEALALAGGLSASAAADRARILRQQPDHPERAEIAVNLRSIMEGRAVDIALESDDILFIPKSKGKMAARAAAEAVLRAGTGIAILTGGRR